MRTTVMWFRRDLRLADNPALANAAAGGGPVACVACRGAVAPGSRADAWRSASLRALDASLRSVGNRLVYFDAETPGRLAGLCRELGAERVSCTRDWTPSGMAEESRVREALSGAGAELVVAESAYLVPPDALRTGAGDPYRVYTPYYKAWLRSWSAESPLAAPTLLPAPASATGGDAFGDARLPAEGAGDDAWLPGEAGAAARLKRFLDDALGGYAELRDRPDLRETSELSPHLAAGDISPRQVARAVERRAGEGGGAKFLAEMAWREFAAAVLHAFPDTATEPLRPEFAAFPWRDAPRDFDAWAHGRTGYPIVDAGMRQLAATGWVHNRVRLIVGSFLTKDLLVPWQRGEGYFAEHLVDYDPASNVFNWQWVSGCGADAAPYFRIFNPMIQGARFDPDGAYVRRWVPELAELPARWIHAPWTAPAEVLGAANVRLGDGYPQPIVDHFEARDRALAAFGALRT